MSLTKEERRAWMNSVRAKARESAIRCDRIKRDGNPCKGIVVKGGKQCFKHGGNKAKGVYNGKYKTGVNSVILPKDIAENYTKFMADPKIVSCKSQAALWKAREAQLLKEINEGSSSVRVRHLARLIREGKKQLARKKTTAFILLEQVEQVVSKELEEWEKWEEVGKASELIRKLVETEAKLMKDLNAVLTLEQALAFVMSCANIAKRHLPAESIPNYLSEMGRTLKIALPSSFKMVETKDLGAQFEEDEAIEGELIEDDGEEEG